MLGVIEQVTLDWAAVHERGGGSLWVVVGKGLIDLRHPAVVAPVEDPAGKTRAGEPGAPTEINATVGAKPGLVGETSDVPL